MKIYTYYAQIAFDNQSELIDLWNRSWSNQGFEPTVLSLNHAKSHPFFDEYDQRLKAVYKYIKGKDISPYEISCYHRWLAYASLNIDEEFYVSDYDLINIKYNLATPQKGLNLLNGLCPVFASGNSENFLNFCKFFVEISETRKALLKDNIILATGKPSPSYHDQDALVNNLNENNTALDDYIKFLDLKITRDYNQVGKDFSIDGNNSNAIHFSRNSILKIQQQTSTDKLRAQLIKLMLN